MMFFFLKKGVIFSGSTLGILDPPVEGFEAV